MQKLFVILHRFVYWLITNNEENKHKKPARSSGSIDDNADGSALLLGQ